MLITESSGLNPIELKALTQLVARCQVVDKQGMRIYWTLIDKARPLAGDICLYSEEKELIAYLGVFLFNQGEVEITALVAPEYRRQGLFKQLLNKALVLIKPLAIKTLIFCCPAQVQSNRAYLAKYQASHRVSEYDLLWQPNNKLNLIANTDYKKRLATAKDLQAIVELDALCLEDDPDKLYFHFSHNLTEANRQIWLLYDKDQFIGKIHLHFLDEAVVIHNICVKPEFQGKGYGYYFLGLILAELNQAGHKIIRMEVEAPNNRALSLYLRLGFVITEQYDFWELPIK